MKALVTGGAGFIGSNVAFELEKKGYDVIVADRNIDKKKSNLEGFKGKIIEADVLDDFETVEKELGEEKIDVIIHEAAVTDTTFADDTEMIRQNVEGFKKMIKLAEKHNAKLVYASSAGTYGNGPAPMREDQNPKPLNAYSKSKVMTDELAKDYFDKMHIVGLRYFNVFGPGEHYKKTAASMIFQTRKKIKNGAQLVLFKHGEQKRDHIYVKDVVKATILAIDAKKSGVYNVGTGIATTFNELIDSMNKVMGTDEKAEYIDNPYKYFFQTNTQADTTNAKKFLNFEADYSVEEGIRDYFKILDEKGL